MHCMMFVRLALFFWLIFLCYCYIFFVFVVIVVVLLRLSFHCIILPVLDVWLSYLLMCACVCVCYYTYLFVISASKIPQDAVWPVRIPCHGAGTAQVWSSGVEHPVRVQRVRSPHQHAANAGKTFLFHLNRLWDFLLLLLQQMLAAVIVLRGFKQWQYPHLAL